MLLLKLGNEEQKREIMGKKKNSKGKKERIWEHLTRRKRKIRYRLEEIARREMAEGKRI